MTYKEARYRLLKSDMPIVHSDQMDYDSICLKALNKQISEKPIKVQIGFRYKYLCPSCNLDEIWTKFCPECGQAIDWSEES